MKKREDYFWMCPRRIIILEYLYKNIGRKKAEISKKLEIDWLSVHKNLLVLESKQLVQNIKKRYSLTPKGKEITNYLLEINKILRER